jgi:hypothetical protein
MVRLPLASSAPPPSPAGQPSRAGLFVCACEIVDSWEGAPVANVESKPPKTPAGNRRLTPQQWMVVQGRAETGESMPSLAHEYGVPVGTIRKRSAAENWQTPARLVKRRRIKKSGYVDTSAARPAEAYALPHVKASEGGQLSGAELLAAVESRDPAVMQSALARLGQGMLRDGLANLDPPRTAGEFATWLRVVQDCLGLNKPGASQGSSLRIPRSIGRPTLKPAAPAQAQPFDLV